MTKDASQEVLKNFKAGGNISIGDVNVGDRYYGSTAIHVTGVGENPLNYADYWVDRTVYETQLRDRLAQA